MLHERSKILATFQGYSYLRVEGFTNRIQVFYKDDCPNYVETIWCNHTVNLPKEALVLHLKKINRILNSSQQIDISEFLGKTRLQTKISQFPQTS